nr:TIGR01440 family protein [Anaerobacillus sp. CMMVII]
MNIFEQITQALSDLESKMVFGQDHILLIGTSTSEVIGQHIGTSGTIEVAEAVFGALKKFQEKTRVHLAFQCCEHLNRAIVVEQKTQRQFTLEEVSVIPVPKAGGSMAAYAYKQFEKPTVVEFIKADAGIDIGDTLIGMHLKHVAVPVRSQIKFIGKAHLTLAVTRPKLIGGARAVYELKAEEGNCD